MQCYYLLTSGEQDMKKVNTILLLSLIVANMNSVVFADIDNNMFIAMTFTLTQFIQSRNSQAFSAFF
jgi:hypothetical protein